LTLFFSDVAGFTRISENLSPSEVFAELGDYFELVTEIIVEKSGGTLAHGIGGIPLRGILGLTKQQTLFPGTGPGAAGRHQSFFETAP
jgi:hypothetical protein